MAPIYPDYQDEPEPLFLPLTEERAASLYALEMDGFTDDLPFYRRWLPARGELLELGCGTGRLAAALAGPARRVTGVDISLPMLDLARRRRTPSLHLVCADLLAPPLSGSFTAILIAYNTLNLLTSKEAVRRCLRHCHSLLVAGGLLLCQFHQVGCPTIRRQGKIFQFQILARPQGGRIIKEVLREQLPATAAINIEERYRIRPEGSAGAFEDLSRHTTLLGLPAATWLELFAAAGFSERGRYGSYQLTPWAEPDNMVLAVFSAQK